MNFFSKYAKLEYGMAAYTVGVIGVAIGCYVSNAKSGEKLKQLKIKEFEEKHPGTPWTYVCKRGIYSSRYCIPPVCTVEPAESEGPKSAKP